ncbi:ABC transporter permease [Thermodesulfobacteriota bacterium]
MMTINTGELSEAPPQTNEWLRIFRVFWGRKVVIFGLAIIIVMIFTAIFAPLLAPYDPYLLSMGESLQQPSAKHLLGTDLYGRDVFSRIIYGSRVSLIVGIASVGMASIIGMTLGLVAGYLGGTVNILIMRFIDALMAIPMLMMALALGVMMGGGLRNVIIALGIALIPTYARLMCGQVLQVKQIDYVKAAEVIGAGDRRIMLWHIFPNTLPPLIVLITLNLGYAILAEAALSFLGLGINPPGAAWGAMVSDGYKFLLGNPVLSFAPGFCVMLVVLAFNLVGDGVRDALDPRLRGII